MMLNDRGKIVLECWNQVPKHFPNVNLDTSVVMPNHLHGNIVILEIATGRGEVTSPLLPQSTLRKPTLGQIVAYFKYQSTKQINQLFNTHGQPIWQRNYFEHIIRNEDELIAFANTSSTIPCNGN